ncbi:MAG: glycosyltransferase family 2 protein [Ilumatobacteraceae bacterium]
MDKISAVIITHNASATIANCINALKKVSDEIIVIDSFSTDDTPEICKEQGIIFIQKNWLGYGPQKNFGIDKTSNNYILSIDADEIISDELATSIKKEKQAGLSGLYNLLFLHYYYVGFLKHGAAKPDTKVRLFNKTNVRWNEREVHEALLIPTEEKIKQLPGYLLHYTYFSISHQIKKIDNYTTLGAKELFKKGKKHYLFKMIFSPPINFIMNYFIRLGFLDGIHGFVLASVTAYESFVKYAKLWEMEIKEMKTAK